ncbi:MAG: CHASE3 domain-containing protein, partial [Proteobacteria bacterium]|nr:CHASE3 domain-containing protein [Pseudomonadota bacterium]
MSARVRPRNRFPLPVFPVLGARVRSATTTIIAIGVVAAAVVLAAGINWQARQTADRVSHAIEIRERAERFLGRMRDAETGQRGFLLTGEAAYLDPFTEGRAAAGPELDILAGLVEADPTQKERVGTLRADMATKFAELDRTISLERAGRRTEALALVKSESGIAAMDRLRDTVQAIQQSENIRLRSLYSREERRRLWGSAGIVVALAGLAFAAWQQLRSRQRRSTALAVSNAELER